MPRTQAIFALLSISILSVFAFGSLYTGEPILPPDPDDSKMLPIAALAEDSEAAAIDMEIASVLQTIEERAPQLTPRERQGLAYVIVAEARRAGFAPETVLAVIAVESSWKTQAVSHAGALGLMQLLPETALTIATEAGVYWEGPDTLFKPVDNIRLGVHYLEYLVDRFGDLPTALAAYNWGPTRIARILRRGRSLPVRYSDRVLNELSILERSRLGSA